MKLNMKLNIIDAKSPIKNYIYYMELEGNNFIIDPTFARPVLEFLDCKKLDYILLTHHHADHINGAVEIREKTGCKIVGYDGDAYRLPSLDIALNDGDKFLSTKIILLKGHTQGHIAYVFPKIIFCGDVLFSLGCGRIFEGSYAEAFTSLQKLVNFPDEMLVAPAHEYTLSNGKFALEIEPNNVDLQNYMKKARMMIKNGEATLPSSIGLEKKTNPFLRCNSLEIRKNIALENASNLEVFTHIRKMKNKNA